MNRLSPHTQPTQTHPYPAAGHSGLFLLLADDAVSAAAEWGSIMHYELVRGGSGGGGFKSTHILETVLQISILPYVPYNTSNGSSRSGWK